MAPQGRSGESHPYRGRLVNDAETVFGDLMIFVVEAAASGENNDADQGQRKAGRMQSGGWLPV